MARSRRMSVHKRLRERKKAEQAELKRVTARRSECAERPAGVQVADREALEGYSVLALVDGPDES